MVDYDDPATTRATVRELREAGWSHIVLNLGAPYPPGVAAWLAGEIIRPARD